ncbi:MAG: NERD domain-containing protein, partial [Methanobacteriales archaeon]|nr:NERD domain-containing protein [Methanobacteriales archaeon]MBC7129409.1 NERD domain-containing protein [Thermoplasmatales archaeon]
MPYLICDKCNVYYEIEDEEEIFEFCECGNRLKYYESLEEYYEEI